MAAPRRRRDRVVSQRAIALAQGAYYLATGLWPLVHMRSFTAVTGPKQEHWLVRTVGLLAVAIAAPLVRAGVRGATAETRTLGAGAAVAFAAASSHPAVTGRVSPIYLVDAALELGLAAAWAAADDG